MNDYQAYGISRRTFLALVGMAGVGALAGCGPQASGGSSTSGVGTDGADGTDSADGTDGSGTDSAAAPDLQERTLFVFDTVVTLSCYCSSELMDEAVARCNRFEELLSRTREGSDVWNVNHAAGAPVAVAPETADVIEKALGYCELSGGLFDITIGAVTQLWDFVEGVKPDDAALAEAVQHIDYRGVHVARGAEGASASGSSGTSGGSSTSDGTGSPTVQLDDPAAAIDLGGIAKGYIADDLAALFREGGCESGIINLGGNAYVIGTKPDGSMWNVGVQDPNGADQQVIAKVPGADLSVVTSGLYEREFTQGGVTYYHILDPATGYPVETDLVSSSVASASSLDGDAYATWMFLLGHDAALDLLNATPGLEGLVVDASGAVSMTDGAEFELL